MMFPHWWSFADMNTKWDLFDLRKPHRVRTEHVWYHWNPGPGTTLRLGFTHAFFSDAGDVRIETRKTGRVL